MIRYTKEANKMFVISQKYIQLNDNGYCGDAINKLSVFENMVEEIISKQDELSKELEVLRSNQQTKSYKFRELLGQKLINSALIALLEKYKLMD